ncbi:MAG: DUF4124 domain-containing protein [Betaproteobacteria bacterium]|nr:DUF4124 domain-containing protein [Betaproteobacteria bacterium]MDE2310259.1 DUF4124 domain-containing protein [Betaproteobacteria bacterium]
MTNAKILGTTLVLFAAFSATAEAKLYKWVDDKGETHYGEVVPPEYANKDKVQFNEKGLEVKKKEPKIEAGAGKKTPEEEQATIDQRRRDNALVNTYSNEKEIDLARDRNLQQVEARINSIQLILKPAQQDLDNYLKEADVLKQGGKKIPDSLQSDITNAENKVAKLKQDLAKAQEKDAAVRASFEADKVRYRELTGGAQK